MKVSVNCSTNILSTWIKLHLQQMTSKKLSKLGQVQASSAGALLFPYLEPAAYLIRCRNHLPLVRVYEVPIQTRTLMTALKSFNAELKEMVKTLKLEDIYVSNQFLLLPV